MMALTVKNGIDCLRKGIWRRRLNDAQATMSLVAVWNAGTGQEDIWLKIGYGKSLVYPIIVTEKIKKKLVK